jgi:hypothetical protein
MSTYTSTRQKLHCDLTSAKAESPVDPEKIKRLEVELKVLESDRLRQQARRWNLELYGSAVGSWETDSYRQWLPQAQQYALAEKLISEARFALIKEMGGSSQPYPVSCNFNFSLRLGPSGFVFSMDRKDSLKSPGVIDFWSNRTQVLTQGCLGSAAKAQPVFHKTLVLRNKRRLYVRMGNGQGAVQIALSSFGFLRYRSMRDY